MPPAAGALKTAARFLGALGLLLLTDRGEGPLRNAKGQIVQAVGDVIFLADVLLQAPVQALLQPAELQLQNSAALRQYQGPSGWPLASRKAEPQRTLGRPARAFPHFQAMLISGCLGFDVFSPPPKSRATLP